jgi:outer membrane receptor protein involved in Fe transport
MAPKLTRGVARYAFALACALLGAGQAGAQGATTTGTVRGVVSGPDGAPTPGVNVLAISNATGVQRGTQTDDAGRYQIPFLDPGVYTLRAQRIGLQAVEKPVIRVALGSVQKVDFQLQSAAVTLSTQRITAEANPLIEETKTGSSTRIDAQQIVELPTSGRDYTDLIKLAPGVSDVGNAGSGGGQSIGGGRTGASNILMDGANNNEGFFGGDARGGDRAPFSFSIEAVKELQVITSAVDVEYGNFTGGAVNAVTKSGANEFSGALFGYFRGAEFGGVKITGQDFLGRDPTAFEQRQYGVAIGGPIVRDKAHFYFTFDKQTSADPRLVFVGAGTGDAFTRSAGISADTLANFLRIAEARGVNLRGELGSLAQNVDQPAFFGRIDWQVSNNHKLTLRNNYTYTTLRNDRLTVGLNLMDLASNAGPNEDKSNSFVGSLQSVFGAVTNELRAQYATVRKPRPSNPTGDLGVPIPQIRINNVRSALSDGSTTVTGIIFGADPVLHANNLETDMVEVIDNVRFTRGNHTYKVGGSFTRQSVYNQFWNNSLGSFTFNSLSDFENNVVTTYTRALPFPGKSQIDVPEFSLNEGAVYAQDEWQVTPRLFLQYGLRYDWVGFPDQPEANPQLTALFPYLDIQDLPDDNNNVSPRFGFTFDPGADGRQIFRGSTAVMYGPARAPTRPAWTSRRSAAARSRARASAPAPPRPRPRPTSSRRITSRPSPGSRTSPTTGCSATTGPSRSRACTVRCATTSSCRTTT